MSNFFLLITCLITIQAFSQDRKFYDSNDSVTDSSDCYYYKTGKYSNVFGWYDSSKSFYCVNNKIRSKEFYDLSTNSGSSYLYHPNGRMKVKMNFKNANIFGLVTEYFSNGKVKSTKLYNESTRRPDLNIFYILINAWDSTGQQMVKNKEGYYKDEFEEGSVKNGLRDSVWIISSKNSKCIEKYKSGQLSEGVQQVDGKSFYYVKIETSAEPNGGLVKFFSKINNSLKYPQSVRRIGVEGKVFIEFIIEPTGDLTNFKIVKGIHKDCDQEAIRVISLTSPWLPARQRGVPVRTKYSLPINFKL
jgi:TonB family protein